MGQARNSDAYYKVTDVLKRQRKGATIADIVAKTALPLQTVRELVPLAADEFSGRLEVTESGEILYSFPRGFTSKYRGFRAGLGKIAKKIKKGIAVFSTWFFKVWIMVMLLGYFLLFMLIALAALTLSVAGSSSNNRSSSRRSGGMGGMYLASSVFNMIIRIWFYSELLKPANRRYGPARPKGKPLYKAIFSFVFGDGDPNADWQAREKQAVIAWIQASRGVISLPEFMALTGLPPDKAEPAISSYCAEFGGLPEATDDGTVVYRFDELLLRADRRDRSFRELSAPIKRLKSFSSNVPSMNWWFGLINGVNLAFGSYFLFHTRNFEALLSQERIMPGSRLFAVAYNLFGQLTGGDPLPLITVGLGIVPLLFSLLFWIIPALRRGLIKKDNETIKLENLRKAGYGRIWDKPQGVTGGDINSPAPECRPRDLASAQDRVIKEMGSYAMPDVSLNDRGETVYSFTELEREKRALETYRASVDPNASSLGNTVFNSDAPLTGNR